MPARTQALRPALADWLQAGGVAAALFALYAATSPRSVALEDDGMFVLSSHFLGIEHPPGYPLFTLLGKLFTLLPFGSVAYRVHLLSALLGALACAALWMCARLLVENRLAAYLAALGLGMSRTFWSQAVIAEVYTLNVLFLAVLVWMGLRAAPQIGTPAGTTALPAMAFAFGLGLANHWPLMLLAAPGFAILLLPRAGEMLRRAPLLAAYFLLGLLPPYAWLVVRSWEPLPISFYGPLETWNDFWFFLSRAGYQGVDVSHTATWLDRVRFFNFLGAELALQFAIAGSLLALLGFAVQWRTWGARISGFLTASFLGPSAALLLLLGFDYDAVNKHVLHVYPLPAYAVAALWMGLGFAWAVRRLGLRAPAAAAACAAVLALVFAVGLQRNLRPNDDWTARYARAMLEAFPRGAVVVARGDWDLTPLAYYHMVEGLRPDITLVQPLGLVLGNRIFHPLRLTEAAMRRQLTDAVKSERRPVAATAFAETYFTGMARRDRWLFVDLDPAAGDAAPSFEIPEALLRFFEDSVLSESDPANAWAAALQGELRRRYAWILAHEQVPGRAPEPRRSRHRQALAADFFGALGLLEGTLANPRGYEPARALELLDRVRSLMPSDASKRQKARYFELRAYLRQERKDPRGALEDLETAVSLWPVRENSAVAALEDQYTAAGDRAALEALRGRLKR